MSQAVSQNVSFTIEQIIAAIAALAGAGGAGAWWKARGEEKVKRIEAGVDEKVKRIEADVSQDLKAMDVLLARVTNLEEHNAKQDIAINRLVEEKAALAAEVTLLRERNDLLAQRNSLLREELRILKARLGELSEPIEDFS